MKEKSDKNMCLDSIIHASDISNPIKTWNPCFNWTNKVMEEFWNQVKKLLYLKKNFFNYIKFNLNYEGR